MKTLQEQQTEAILAMAKELQELREWKQQHLSKITPKITEFAKEYCNAK